MAKRYSPIYATTAGYTPLSWAAIDNGIVGKIDSLANDGQTDFRFAWTRGSSMVAVNVIGPALTLREAAAVTRRAVPA